MPLHSRLLCSFPVLNGFIKSTSSTCVLEQFFMTIWWGFSLLIFIWSFLTLSCKHIAVGIMCWSVFHVAMLVLWTWLEDNILTCCPQHNVRDTSKKCSWYWLYHSDFTLLAAQLFHKTYGLLSIFGNMFSSLEYNRKLETIKYNIL